MDFRTAHTGTETKSSARSLRSNQELGRAQEARLLNRVHLWIEWQIAATCGLPRKNSACLAEDNRAANTTATFSTDMVLAIRADHRATFGLHRGHSTMIHAAVIGIVRYSLLSAMHV